MKNSATKRHGATAKPPVTQPVTQHGTQPAAKKAEATRAGAVHLDEGREGIAELRLGGSDEDIVTLTEARIASLEAAIGRLEKLGKLRGVLVLGSKPGMFAAGADIHAIADIKDAVVGEAAAQRGRTTFDRLANLRVPVVAVIEGPCLGGGLELALACDMRIASDATNTKIGLPEVRLGIVPGFGGTQRLPRLIGLPKAVDLILRGKLLSADEAARAGVVDKVAPKERLEQVARRELAALIAANTKQPRRKPWSTMTRLLSKTGVGRALVRRKAEAGLNDGNARFYPAPKAALALCLDAFALPPAEGFRKEAKALGELIASPIAKALVRVFLLSEAQKKLGKADGAVAIEQALTLGAGVMGAGIASVMAQSGVRVRLCDVNGQALAGAKARLQKDLDRRLRRRALAPHEAQAIQDRLTIGLCEWGRLDHCDLFLEAIVEDLGVKQKVFADAISRGLRADAIVATNTSSLSIDAMAQTLPAPERLVGIHFFNPPEKMPLVEVVRGSQTSAAAVASACRLATQLGKYPIVVKDAPGFLVNRCLAPYLNQAAKLLLEGVSAEQIDRVMLDFGMPMGPCRLLDEIGWDIAAKVSETLSKAFTSRMPVSPLFQAMVEAKALGAKSGGGLFDRDGEGAGPGRAVVQRLRNGKSGIAVPNGEIRTRLLYPMVDEAYRCLADGVVASVDELDLGLIFGIGFPPFLGGLSGFVQSEGAAKIAADLDLRARRGEANLAPSTALQQAAKPTA
jgi:3-hydroxyacyl-CoA dehydrogenase/enoyl-CoA hydratase/3-hydroxybutyryl-CoA epimerase